MSRLEFHEMNLSLIAQICARERGLGDVGVVDKID